MDREDVLEAGESTTLPRHRSAGDVIRDRDLRRLGLLAGWLLIGLAMVGLLGVRTASVSGESDGWSLRVKHPGIIRPALDAAIDIEISHLGGFDRPIHLRVPRVLLEHLDVNLLSPAPSAETGTIAYVEWTYEPPVGDAMVIAIDSRLSPAQMPGWERLDFSIVDGDGDSLVEASSTMLVLP